jgi:hypothetical protein
MLVNKNKEKTNTERVKFVSYTGEYPNLCRGVLTLEIDGVQYKFGHEFSNYHFDENCNGYFSDEDPEHPNFDSFWSPGGSVTHDSDWNFDVDHGEWEIDVQEIPEQFRELAAEIDAVFNENVEYGCCGGCI